MAAGSPATNEYRPQRSERSTDSSSSAGPSPAIAGKRPTGVADVGQQLRPHRHERPVGRHAVEGRSDRGGPAGLRPWPPSSRTGGQIRVNPGPRVRGSWAMRRCDRVRRSAAPGSTSPRTTTRSSTCVAIRAGWSHARLGPRQRPSLVPSFDASTHRAVRPVVVRRARDRAGPRRCRAAGRRPDRERALAIGRPRGRADPETARRPSATTAPRRRPRACARHVPRRSRRRSALGTRTPDR